MPLQWSQISEWPKTGHHFSSGSFCTYFGCKSYRNKKKNKYNTCYESKSIYLIQMTNPKIDTKSGSMEWLFFERCASLSGVQVVQKKTYRKRRKFIKSWEQVHLVQRASQKMQTQNWAHKMNTLLFGVQVFKKKKLISPQNYGSKSI